VLGAGFKPVVRYSVSWVGSTPTGFRHPTCTLSLVLTAFVPAAPTNHSQFGLRSNMDSNSSRFPLQVCDRQMAFKKTQIGTIAASYDVSSTTTWFSSLASRRNCAASGSGAFS
jgi:hypothetical protein